mmetsp:Transcript_1194/g.3057  ORF Transcript_1194/g.3057 Transcript_1194/m.3057 type:complete len:83 (-) Transcript_1194:157-405(-)
MTLTKFKRPYSWLALTASLGSRCVRLSIQTASTRQPRKFGLCDSRVHHECFRESREHSDFNLLPQATVCTLYGVDGIFHAWV